jgi:hypothetical protein
MRHATLLFGVATLAFGSASAYLLQEVREERERSTALQARVQELEQARARPSPFRPSRPTPSAVGNDSKRTVASAEPPVAALAAAPSAAISQAIQTSPQPAMSPRNRRNEIERQLKLLQEDPEYRAAMRTQQRMQMSRQYSDVGQALQLQPDEADKLLDLLAEQQLRQMENRPPFNEGQPDPAAMQEWQRKQQEQRRQNESEVAALLGSAKAQEWQSYQKTMPARTQVRELSTMLASSSNPLRQEQVQPLVDAIAAEQQRRSTELPRPAVRSADGRPATPMDRTAMMEENLKRVEQYNQRMHDAAALHLSSQQLERFDQILKQQLEMQRANLSMMRARAAVEAHGGTTVSTTGALVPASSQ